MNYGLISSTNISLNVVFIAGRLAMGSINVLISYNMKTMVVSHHVLMVHDSMGLLQGTMDMTWALSNCLFSIHCLAFLTLLVRKSFGPSLIRTPPPYAHQITKINLPTCKHYLAGKSARKLFGKTTRASIPLHSDI